MSPRRTSRASVWMSSATASPLLTKPKRKKKRARRSFKRFSMSCRCRESQPMSRAITGFRSVEVAAGQTWAAAFPFGCMGKISGALFMNQRLQELAEASFRQKQERRRELAALPIEEKVEIRLRLQQMVADLAWETQGVKLEP